MFNKILIANRGEIACRIIKTAKLLGIETVAVYSDADKNALHVTMADESIHIGASPSRESYLQINKIISAAKQTGAQAIHPGYGFLSENADFCRACQANDLIFIGPPVTAIEAMGSKSAAKKIMEQANVPLVPGYHGEDQSPEVLKHHSDTMGYPVLLKAAAGGGGKGMRQVWQAEEFDEALAAAKREATNAFGDCTMLVEKYLTGPRHVEIQIFCDRYGNGVYLFERDCSLQRRHQKVVEEAPAPGLSDTLRQAMGEAAIRAAQAINYEGAGTVEFLLDRDGCFYFMEMNTRLQVEHPVTEMISGQDLVEWQLRVASGQKLPCQQADLTINGHAFEVRIYAEDPDNDFLPVTGWINQMQLPEITSKVRIDTGIQKGDEVSVYYDPMLAKLIVWGKDRAQALQLLRHSLKQYRIGGIKTNLSFLHNLVSVEAFANADLDTRFIEHHEQEIFQQGTTSTADLHVLAALFVFLQDQQANKVSLEDVFSPWQQTDHWRLNLVHTETITILSNEQQHTIAIEVNNAGGEPEFTLSFEDQIYTATGRIDDTKLHVTLNGHGQKVSVFLSNNKGVVYGQKTNLEFSLPEHDFASLDSEATNNTLTAPMNGTIIALTCSPLEPVKKGTPLLIMEAMKMEHTIRAPSNGHVEEFYFNPGDLVSNGMQLLSFSTNEEQ